MQKKSLLVALFCGALCLTGCLKNEESASVAQVRIAKANELNSIADLNKAKAAAEAVYAEAELTVAKAEAKLREANAALVLAQAETEKVRAELLKVRVALAEVKVDEEKIQLQMLEADLEQKLAEVEAAVAMAEAEKQGWINVLEHAIAAAEAQAITDAQAILEAEQALEAAVLKMEKAQADSAKAASVKYFAALDEVQNLQKEQIETKAMKALVEAGALQVRDAIYQEMDKIDDQIEEKKAIVAALKEYQTKTPEQAKEDLIAAREALNEAYNEYKAALDIESAANDVLNGNEDKKITGIKNMTADFTQDWYPTTTKSDVFTKAVTDSLAKDGVTVETNIIEVTIGDNTEKITAAGIVVNKEFIPFWNNQDATNKVTLRYPDTDVYGKLNRDYITLDDYSIVPAAIYYDNIKEALDTLVAHKEQQAQKNVEFVGAVNEWWAKFYEAQIAENEDKIELHEDYIAAREDAVTEAEEEYRQAIKDANDASDDIKGAWDTFQKYMLVKHSTISRSFFTDVFDADTAYIAAEQIATDKKNALETAQGVLGKDETEGLRKDVLDAFEAYAKAEGAYNIAIDSLENDGPAKAAHDSVLQYTGESRDGRYGKYGAYNPVFAAATVTARPSISEENHWVIGKVGTNVIHAGSAQDALLNAEAALKDAKEKAYRVKIDYYRGYKTESDVTEAEGNITLAEDQVDVAEAELIKASDKYTILNNKYKAAMKGGATLEEATLAYNPNFFSGKIFDAVTFPTPAEPNKGWRLNKPHYNSTTKEWSDNNGDKARSAQAAVLNAVQAVIKQMDVVEKANKAYDNNVVGNERGAKQIAADKLKKLEKAEAALIAAIEGVEVEELTGDEDIEDYLDEEAENLYAAYVAAKEVETTDREEAWNKLLAAYGSYPDVVGPERSDDNVDWYRRNFGWLISSFNVDYEATMLNYWGVEVPIASLYGYQFVDGQFVPNYSNSLAYQNEQAQEMIDEILPKILSDYKKEQADEVADFKAGIKELVAKIEAYKAYENGYKTWIAQWEAAEEAVNEAKKAVFDAKQEYNDAKAEYEAAEAVANEGLWVYDPKDAQGKNKTGKTPDNDGFVWITIADQIELLEGKVEALTTGVNALFTIASTVQTQFNTVTKDQEIDIAELKTVYDALIGKEDTLPDGSIAELNFTKNILEQALKYGKIGLQIVVDAFDAEIAELEEKIEVYTKIAEIYKAIMNAYLGIVDEADAEGETGPLDGEGEGDDEE